MKIETYLSYNIGQNCVEVLRFQDTMIFISQHTSAISLLKRASSNTIGVWKIKKLKP